MINLELEVAEVNGILQALGNIPFAQVAPLIKDLTTRITALEAK